MADPYATVTYDNAPGTASQEKGNTDTPRGAYDTVDFTPPAPQGTVTVTGAPSNVGDLVESGAGLALAKLNAKPYNLTPKFVNAQNALAEELAKHEVHTQAVNDIETKKLANYAQAQDVHNIKLDALKNAELMHEQALAHATALDALPPEGAGAKWIPTSAAAGTPTGTAETTVSEAGKLSRTAKVLKSGEGLTNSGIIVPEKYGNAPPILTAEQETAKTLATKNYIAAKEALEAQKQIAFQSASDLHKLGLVEPKGLSTAQAKVTDSLAAQAALKQQIGSLTPIPNAMDKLIAKIPYGQEAVDTLGKGAALVNKIPGAKFILPTAGVGLGGLQLTEGYDNLTHNDKIHGALQMASGVGGVVGAIPTPYTRGAGLALQAPLAAYELGKYGYNKLYPPK